MEGFPPKKNNDSNQPMEPDYLATQIDPYFKKKSYFLHVERLFSHAVQVTVKRNIHIIIAMC